MMTAPTTGIVTYHCELGDELNEGDLIAKIVLLDQPKPTEIEIRAPITGYMFSQSEHYFVSPGHTICMLATDEQQLAAGTQLAF
jgi:predicted deacylase